MLRNGSFLVLTVLLIVSGCGSTKLSTSGVLDKKLAVKTIIRNHISESPQFKTLNGRLVIDYSDGSASQSVSVTLRMKKDEVIWLSAPLGVIKVYITPGKVSYYNKLQNEYFEGDFSFLSQILGSELDFKKLQNMLLGQTIMDLRESTYALSYTESAYQLKPENSLGWLKIFFEIEPGNFNLSAQHLAQPDNERLMEVYYKGYQKVNGQNFPEDISIVAREQNEEVKIALTLKQLELNRDLSFPYKIPNGFNPIVVK